MDNTVLSLFFWDSDGDVGPVQLYTQSKYNYRDKDRLSKNVLQMG